MLTIGHPGAVSGMAWTVLRGGREEVMRALGAEHADLIAAQRDDATGGWRANVSRADELAERFGAVVASTRRLLPLESQELAWIAEGAGVAERELWAQNLRGDLGRDGTGCSDVSLCTGERDGRAGGVVLGHNEDGAGEIAGLVRLVTLAVEGDPAMTVVWYPGMLPANTFVTTSAGLSFGMDHVPVRVALCKGAGRHFVARHAQRQPDGVSARDALHRIPCAGGFAFDVADHLGRRVDVIENAAGVVASATVTASAPSAGRPLTHTNHLCVIDSAAPVRRGAVRDGWARESDARLDALRAATHGIRDADEAFAALRSPGVLNRGDDLWTFTTTVVDSADDRVLVQATGEVWSGVWSAFARGERMSR